MVSNCMFNFVLHNVYEKNLVSNLSKLEGIDIHHYFLSVVDDLPEELKTKTVCILRRLTFGWKLYVNYLVCNAILNLRKDNEAIQILEIQSVLKKIEAEYSKVLSSVQNETMHNLKLNQIINECKQFYLMPVNINQCIYASENPVFMMPNTMKLHQLVNKNVY